MTTLELIERGIGHNCLSDAYELGRTDAERDFQNSDYWNDYLAQVIKDAKADAIEEMFSKIDKLAIYYAGDKDGNAITPKMLIKDDVFKVLEQLKQTEDGGKERYESY